MSTRLPEALPTTTKYEAPNMGQRVLDSPSTVILFITVSNQISYFAREAKSVNGRVDPISYNSRLDIPGALFSLNMKTEIEDTRFIPVPLKILLSYFHLLIVE